MPQTNTNTQFVNNLVTAITGSDLYSYDKDFQPKLITNCLKAFTDYIGKYIGEKYGEMDSLRIRSALKYPGDIFQKFPDLKTKYDEAYHSFLVNLQNK
jgi:hypothetical protein